MRAKAVEFRASGSELYRAAPVTEEPVTEEPVPGRA
jgi:hypothetical protein